MNEKQAIIAEIDNLATKKLEYAKEELENIDIEWDDNYLNVKDYSPELDEPSWFNFYLGGYIALMELKEKL